MSPEFSDFESVLGSLSPVAASLDRDRVMFAAGAATAGRRMRRLWAWNVTTTAVLLLVSIGWGMTITTSERTSESERIVERNELEPSRERWEAFMVNERPPRRRTANSPVAGRANYLQLRQLVLTQGFESLPLLPVVSASSDERPPLKAGSRELLDDGFGI